MKKNAYLYDLKKYGSKIMTDKKHFNKHAIRVAFGLFMIVIYCLMGGLSALPTSSTSCQRQSAKSAAVFSFSTDFGAATDISPA